MGSSNRRKKGISGFFSHICSSLIAYWTHDLWNVLDTVTITLLFAQGTKWWWWCTTIIPTFAPKSSRWVYESLFTNARFLRLHQTVHSMMNATNSTNSSMYKDPTLDLNGNYIHTRVPFSISNVWNKTNTTIAPIGNYNMGGYEYENLFKLGWSNELDEIVEEFNNAEKIISIRAELDVLIVIIILCQVMRLLKVLDFQPKLALVTSTLLNGGWELFHFIIVFGMQTVAFSACAHVAFGSIHPKFANYGDSISTCFNLFLGDTSTHDDLSQSDRAIGWYAFFLTYMLLQTFILLNILLAILVDAYIAVRSSATLSSDVITEIIHIRSFSSQRNRSFIASTQITFRTCSQSNVYQQKQQQQRQRRQHSKQCKKAWDPTNSTKVMPNNLRRRKNKKKNNEPIKQDIMVPKMVDGEAKFFAADRTFLLRAMNKIKEKELNMLKNGNKSTNSKLTRLLKGKGKHDINDLLDALFDRLGVDRKESDTDSVTDDNGETDIRLGEVSELLDLDWSKMNKNTTDSSASTATRSPPEVITGEGPRRPPPKLQELQEPDWSQQPKQAPPTPREVVIPMSENETLEI